MSTTLAGARSGLVGLLQRRAESQATQRGEVGRLTLPVVCTALLLAVVLAWCYQWGVPLRASHGARVTADEPFYLLTTVSLLEDGDLDLRNDYELKRYSAFYDHPQPLWHQSAPDAQGRILSPHNVGLSLLIAPAYALGGVDAAKGFLGLIGGLTAAGMMLLAYRITGNLGASVISAGLLGLSAPLFVYSTQVYPEMPAALCLVLATLILVQPRLGWRGALLLLLAFNGLAWLGSKYLLVGAVAGLIALARMPAGLRGPFLLGTAVTGMGYAWFHLATYGGLTPYVVNVLYAGKDTLELVGSHFVLWERLYRLAGLWFDGEFGVLRWAPVLLLALPAVPWLLRQPPRVRWTLALLLVTQVLVAVFFSLTMRGWWFPGRMLIVVLPLLAPLLAWTLSRVQASALWMGSAAALGLYTLLITRALYAEAGGGGCGARSGPLCPGLGALPATGPGVSLLHQLRAPHLDPDWVLASPVRRDDLQSPVVACQSTKQCLAAFSSYSKTVWPR